MDWHARYHRAALDGMRSLTLEERGAYQTLLDLMYDYGRAIPDDPRWLAGWMGTSVRRWNAVREALITKGKITCTDGFISNSRALFEIEKSVKHLRNIREAGRKGGEKSAELRAKANENKPPAPSAAASEAASENVADLKLKTIHRQDSAAADAGDVIKLRIAEAQERAGAAVNLSNGSVHHYADLRRMLDAGCHWDLDILPAIDAIAAGVIAKRKTLIQSWAHDGIVEHALRNRDRRLQGLPDPQPIKTNGAANGRGASSLPSDDDWARAAAAVARNAAT